ncbi:hypothetical protein [Nocardia sp. NPDC049149]|uniref:Rv0361 family membrane protein n=1 Tax=Nocardia sp. NPDC049149 TaxID=3364315 RepID=UPI00371926C1
MGYRESQRLHLRGEQVAVTDPPPSRFQLTPARMIALIAAFVLAGIGCAVALVIYQTQPEGSDDARIRSVIKDFASAVESGSTAQVTELLCEEEAATFTDRVSAGEEPDAGGQSDVDQERRPVDISDVAIRGEVASALVARPPSEPRRLHFRKEGDRWKVCAPAADQFG